MESVVSAPVSGTVARVLVVGTSVVKPEEEKANPPT